MTNSREAPAHLLRSTRLAAVVYNPIKVDLDSLKAVVKTAETDAGWGETLWFETSEDDPGTGMAMEALAQGATMVIAAGGDGTVRAAAEALSGADASLALLPSGTGNLLARNLSLTLDDVEHAVSVAFDGEDRAIDVGMIDIRHGDRTRERRAFLVMSGIGLDASMASNVNTELKKKLSWLAYVDSIVRAMRDKNQLRLRFRSDGDEARSLRAHTIIIGNCGSLPANILLLPDAAIDDGELDVVLLRPEGFFGWLRVGVKVFWENGVLRRTKVGRRIMSVTKEINAVRYLRVKNLDVVLDKAYDIELDGDPFGTARAFHTWVEPSALRVRVPKGSTPDDDDDDERNRS